MSRAGLYAAAELIAGGNLEGDALAAMLLVRIGWRELPEGPGCRDSLEDLAGALGVHRATAARAMGRLRRGGLVLEMPSSGRGRERLVYRLGTTAPLIGDNAPESLDV